jgi:hypothetical protein
MAKKRSMIDPYSKRNGLPFVLMLLANLLIIFGVLLWIIGSLESGLLAILVAAVATRIEAWLLWVQLLDIKKSAEYEEAPKYKLGKL